MKKSIVCALWVIIIFTGCHTPKQLAASKENEAAFYPYGPAWAALWQQQSGEYKALCFQAYHLAAMRLDELLKQQVTKPPAIVTDIDETLLDNSAYTVHQALAGQLYSEATWLQWTAKAAADTVPGALSFFRYAASKGVEIFYITNRLEEERAATLLNLRKWGFPDADDTHLMLKGATSNKDDRRAKVAETHHILLLIGDNLGDFSGIYKQPYKKRNELAEQTSAHFGEDYIVLPNPMYGDWEGALFNYKYDLPVAEKDSLFRRALKNYSK